MFPSMHRTIARGGGVVPYLTHNQEVAGSNPAPATKAVGLGSPSSGLVPGQVKPTEHATQPTPFPPARRACPIQSM